jgi:uncharacterized protein (DUF1501 family)
MTPFWDRRAFLAAAAAPFLSPFRTETALLPRGAPRSLVVLELLGGNDGLNTVIPVDDEDYRTARPRLSAVRSGAHALAHGFALHPALAQLHARLRAGTGAIVHGVGYPRPDRSHFRSRDIWHTGDPAHERVTAKTTGWLGRAAEQLALLGAGMPAASIGGVQVPLLLRAARVVVPTLERAEDFELFTDDGGGHADGRRQGIRAIAAAAQPGGSTAAFVQAVAVAAVQQAELLQAQMRRYRAQADYPDSGLGRDLQLIARMVVAGFGTRLFHLGFGGFDTHALQLPTHDGLLRQLDGALAAFLRDLEGHDRLADTIVLVHSEFGRRVAENASHGTDHGAAAPVFLFGGTVRPGQHGVPPDLDDLDDGDLRATVDFRSIYADLLGWLSIDAAAVLGAGIAPAGVCGA